MAPPNLALKENRCMYKTDMLFKVIINEVNASQQQLVGKERIMNTIRYSLS